MLLSRHLACDKEHPFMTCAGVMWSIMYLGIFDWYTTSKYPFINVYLHVMSGKTSKTSRM